MATKDDIRSLEQSQLAMKEELKQHVEGLFRDLMVAVDEKKADKSDLLKLEKRVEKLEHI